MTTNRIAFLRITSMLPMFALTLAVLGWGSYTYFADKGFERATDSEVMAIRPHAEGSPAAILTQHQDECWRGTEQAKAEVPSAAIIQVKGGAVQYTKAYAKVDAAFREALSKAGYGSFDAPNLEVIALCI